MIQISAITNNLLNSTSNHDGVTETTKCNHPTLDKQT